MGRGKVCPLATITKAMAQYVSISPPGFINIFDNGITKADVSLLQPNSAAASCTKGIQAVLEEVAKPKNIAEASALKHERNDLFARSAVMIMEKVVQRTAITKVSKSKPNKLLKTDRSLLANVFAVIAKTPIGAKRMTISITCFNIRFKEDKKSER